MNYSNFSGDGLIKQHYLTKENKAYLEPRDKEIRNCSKYNSLYISKLYDFIGKKIQLIITSFIEKY